MLENKINTTSGTTLSGSVHSTLLKIRTDKIVPRKVQASKVICKIRKFPIGWKVDLAASNTTGEVKIWWK